MTGILLIFIALLILQTIVLIILGLIIKQKNALIEMMDSAGKMLLEHNKQLTACFDTFPEYKPPKVELPPKKQYEPGDWAKDEDEK